MSRSSKVHFAGWLDSLKVSVCLMMSPETTSLTSHLAPEHRKSRLCAPAFNNCFVDKRTRTMIVQAQDVDREKREKNQRRKAGQQSQGQQYLSVIHKHRSRSKS